MEIKLETHSCSSHAQLTLTENRSDRSLTQMDLRMDCQSESICEPFKREPIKNVNEPVRLFDEVDNDSQLFLQSGLHWEEERQKFCP
jgi:hypothetical protein